MTLQRALLGEGMSLRKGLLNGLGWRHVKGLEDVVAQVLLVAHGQRGREGQLRPVRVLVFLAQVLAPALLYLKLKEHSRLGGHIALAPLVSLRVRQERVTSST